MGGHDTRPTTQREQDHSSAQSHECGVQPRQVWPHPLCIPEPQNHTTGLHHPSGRNHGTRGQAYQIHQISGGQCKCAHGSRGRHPGNKETCTPHHSTGMQACTLTGHIEGPSGRMHTGQMAIQAQCWVAAACQWEGACRGNQDSTGHHVKHHEANAVPTPEKPQAIFLYMQKAWQ